MDRSSGPDRLVCCVATMMMKLAPLLLASCLLVAIEGDGKLRAESQWRQYKRAGELPGYQNCDPLLANVNLAASCQCKEPDPAPDENLDAASGSFDGRISQLTCSPDNRIPMGALLEELGGLLSSTILRIDHLTINANITNETDHDKQRVKPAKRLALVEALTLQLSVDGTFKSKLENQLMDFHHIIETSKLKILFILIEYLDDRRQTNSVDCHLDLTNFMVPLVSLEKFELNFILPPGVLPKQMACASYFLNSKALKQQAKLKSLNLAHSRLKLNISDSLNSPFRYSQDLESLNLEGNLIERFPISNLLAGQQEDSSSWQGLGSLSSLSLAHNRLASLEVDIFADPMAGNESSLSSRVCLGMDGTRKWRPFRLPAMNQLDLSRNQLSDITFTASQMILCTMPNLSQLYLRNNRLVSLNLNAILQFPFRYWPSSISAWPTTSIDSRALESSLRSTTSNIVTDSSSQLEILDLSHNRLRRVTVFEGPTRIRSQVKLLNLDNNQLQGPITSLDSRLLDRVLFQETFNSQLNQHGELLGLDHLDSLLSLGSASANLTLCDLLSSSSSSNEQSQQQLNELSLASNHLRRLMDDTFASKSCRDIQILRLNRNLIDLITPSAFLQLIDLEHLTLANNLLDELPDQVFNKNYKLRILDLSGNRLTSLDRKLLWRLQKLESLQLSNNQLFELQGDFLSQNQRLETLDLSNNKLTHLDDSLLQNLKLLKLINLHNNRLKFLDQSTFSRSNHQLEYIDLHGNQLSRIQGGTFSGSSMGSLRHLDLGKNSLLMVKLADMSSQIEKLDLSENQNLVIEASDLLAIIGKANIKVLDLGKISAIRWTGTMNEHMAGVCQLLRDRPYVERLTLSGLQQIDGQLIRALDECSLTFDGLGLASLAASGAMQSDQLSKWLAKRLNAGLEWLDVSANELGQQQMGAIMAGTSISADPIHLTHLNLSMNLLHRWPFNESHQQGARLGKLKSLDLSRNSIRHLFTMDIPLESYSLGSLEVLNLSSNFMQSVTRARDDGSTASGFGLGFLMQNLRFIDLSDNELSWIPEGFFSNLHHNPVLLLHKNNLKNLRLSLNAGRSMILDLGSNPIEEIQNSGQDRTASSLRSHHIEARDLILLDEHRGSLPVLRCLPIDDYIELRRLGDQQSPALSMDETDECQGLASWIDHIKLSQIEVKSIGLADGRFLHLSMRGERRTKVTLVDGYISDSMIYWDLSENELSHSESIHSSGLPRLEGLDLSYNKLTEMPWTYISSCCPKLKYLDLSFNRISQCSIDRSMSHISIYILHLNNNLLRDLGNMRKQLELLPSLRLLDLRFNQLKYDTVIPKLEARFSHLTILPSRYQLTSGLASKPRININGSQIQFEWPTKSSAVIENSSLGFYTFKNQTGDNENLIYSSENLHKPIGFCTLVSGSQLTKVCLRLKSGFEDDSHCFVLKIPKNITSCLTNLQIPKHYDASPLNDSKGNHEQQAIVSQNETGFNSLDVSNSGDPVITVIESIKRNWIKARGFSFNEYLTSIVDVRNNSVWTTIGGQYPVYTISILKVAIVSGAICIVGLLVAMFSLLTNLKYHGKRSKVYCEEGVTKPIDSHSDTETGEMSTLTDNQSTKRSSDRDEPSHAYNRSGSKLSSSRETVSRDTVRQMGLINAGPNYHLDSEQLVACQPMTQNRHPQHASISLTPSSSLAPSSVGTAETLQAVDSINSMTPSGMPLMNSQQIISVDQYANDSLENAVASDESNSMARPHIATVMRMVKSNSTNFESNARRRASQQQTQQLYGTLGHRHVCYNDGYASMRSKIRAVQEIHRQQCPVYGVNTSQVPTISNLNNRDAGGSKIVSSDHLDLEPFIVTPPPMLADDHPDLNDAIATPIFDRTLIGENGPMIDGASKGNLCNFHRASSQMRPAQNIIFELEEDDQYQESSGHYDQMDSNLPPPPSSRAIEALENSLTYHQRQMTDRRAG